MKMTSGLSALQLVTGLGPGRMQRHQPGARHGHLSGPAGALGLGSDRMPDR